MSSGGPGGRTLGVEIDPKSFLDGGPGGGGIPAHADTGDTGNEAIGCAAKGLWKLFKLPQWD